MKLNEHIFRANDIRGIAYDDLNEQVVSLLGRSLGSEALSRDIKELIIGRDGRVSSPEIMEWLSSGILSTGCNVIDIGIVTSPMLYHSTFELAASSGVVITGSHNPGEYNGFKIVFKNRSTSSDEILLLKKRIINRDFQLGQGKLDKADIKESYINRIVKSIQLNKALDISIDCGNGAAGVVAKEIYEKLGCNVTELYGNPDGLFPNHHPDPTVEDNLVDLQREVLAHKADFGIAFDGDGDRIGVVDEKGQILWGDQLLILFARAILQEEPGATIVGEVKCSQIMYDDIEKHGGKAVMWKTGHSLIKDQMKKVKAAIAGEMSGHIFFKHRFFGFDDATYAGLRLLEIVSKSDAPLSELLSDLPKLYSTPELRVECPEELKFELVDKVTEFFKAEGHKVIDIDGARVVFEDGWGLVRCSNTGPILVMRFEAKNPERLAEIRKYIEDSVQSMRERIS